MYFQLYKYQWWVFIESIYHLVYPYLLLTNLVLMFMERDLTSIVIIPIMIYGI